jgi:hypothetical protein
VRVFGEPIRSLWPAANWFKFRARDLPPSWPRCGGMSQKRIVVVQSSYVLLDESWVRSAVQGRPDIHRSGSAEG